ncbi:MAG: hypothetical protein A2017_15065 [Lentisphaerae bacterium GWF2_44_16]|nr:MAG: hypothetical protein A2017_15065 [Lentisphaerae bacterium GWF2_44_16]
MNKCKNLKWLCLTASVFLMLAACELFSEETYKTYDNLAGKIITPHIKWANPYSEGKIKTLVIAPAWGQRETVELAQRLSLDYTPMMLHEYTAIGAARGVEGLVQTNQIYKLFEKKLEESYDLIIIGKIKWSIIPAKIRTEILRKIYSDGVGLLYVNPPEMDKELEVLFNKNKLPSNNIMNALPAQAIPILKNIPGDKLFLSGTFGKGRIALLNYNQKATPFDDYYRHCLTPREGYGDIDLYYDYLMAMVAKAAIWTAGKESCLTAKEVIPSAEKIDFSFVNSSPGIFDFNFVIRDLRNNIEQQQKGKREIKEGKNILSFPLPALKDGAHFIDLWIIKDGKTIDWASSYMEINAVNKIVALTLNKDHYEADETLRGELTLEKAVSSGKIRIEFKDNFNRIIDFKEFTGTNKTFPFTFKIGHPLSILLSVKAVLISETGIMSEKTVSFPVPQRGNGDFSFVMWSAENDEQLSKLILNAYQSNGVDTVLDLSALPKRLTNNDRRIIAGNIARANLKIIPTVWSFFCDDFHVMTPDGPARRPCLSDKAFHEETKKYLKTATELYGIYGPVGYNLGDENSVSDKLEVCYGAQTLCDLRKYLQIKYGSLEELNKIWQSSFDAWEKVKPMNWKQARGQKNYASWLDHRLFMEKIFADSQIEAANTIKSVDKYARAGFEGPLRSRTSTGYDFYKLFSNLDFFGLYPDSMDRFGLLRSFIKKNSFTGSWFGAYDGAIFNDYTRAFPWFCLFEGMNSCWWFGGTLVKGAGGNAAFTVDLQPFEYFQTTSSEIKEIKSGLGKLLIGSKLKTDPVAIYYSPISKYAYAVDEPNSPLSYENSINSFCYLLQDLGFQSRSISSVEVEQGKLTQDFCRVLILPSTRALSEKEAANISKFVKEGGTIIADLPPGSMDCHCAMLKEASLKSVFGDFTSVPAYNVFGKGKAVYLGTFFKTYTAERVAGTGEDKRRIFKTILENSGIHPMLKILTKDGTPLQATMTSVFKGKDATYAGLLYFSGPSRNPNERIKNLKQEKATVIFPEASHIYDMREKKYLGFTDKVEVEMTPSQAKVLAMLPKQIESIDLKLSKAEKLKGGDNVNYEFFITPSLSSVARLEVTNPDGMKIPYYAKNILFDGKYSGIIPLSFNEKAGEYTIQIEEVVSGKTATGKFTVIGGKAK